MEKYYCLRVNEENIHFKNLEDVKKWFKTCGVEDVLFTEEEGVIYSLDFLEYLVGFGEVRIVNESMCERGDDYCSIRLEEFKFEFQNN